VDDDCDGMTDEGLGTTSCGVGACNRIVQNCVAGVPQTCTPGTPGAETCNGLDDDCDGAVDEGMGTTSCGVGVCARTVESCVAGVPQTCTPGTPTVEACNDLDDDCDGSADEDFDQDGDGVTTCGGDCNDLVAMTYPGAPETCNGVDDNCNLIADEGFQDSDADGLADCLDPDDDNDLIPDASDCAPLVNSVSAVPGEVGPTVKAINGSPAGTFSFAPAAQANVFNVYRGVWDHVSGAWSDALTCLVSESPAPGFVDADNPPIGFAFYYVVTGTNRCGEGPASRDRCRRAASLLAVTPTPTWCSTLMMTAPSSRTHRNPTWITTDGETFATIAPPPRTPVRRTPTITVWVIGARTWTATDTLQARTATTPTPQCI
jgi:hypothetical protein